ncbi:Spo0B domain-containing protein [Amphibacillus sp. MSJ-3]|uniref:Spo0B domain-containing protein n=1 Tax=Amphibacillus sp. MSJ-3 TaxID=2841505 RepID=UPI001C0E8F16|nr:Spo0B domain-containing protein [Amphibacillus sp. MSJ-3]MBU5593588.1 Spo0B domain-containing protein [Amphibacillus sp. MSJ-3]
MTEQEAIDLLRHYRHAFSNHIQLMISYAQMGKLDHVQEKGAELIDQMTRDQQFQSMPLPRTIVSLLQLNHANSGMQWAPIVHLDAKPKVDDQVLSSLIQSIHQLIIEQSMNLLLYHGTIKFHQPIDQPFQLKIICHGTFNEIDQFKFALLKLDNKIQIESATKEGVVFNWTAQD